MKRKRRVFQTSESAYRAFLNKFSENKKFNDACIVSALNYAFSETFKSTIPSDTKSHLVKVILASREKILNDLNALRDSPDTKIQPLGCKQKQSNDDIVKTVKKRKLNNDDVSHKKTIIANESKGNYSNKRSSKRNLTKNENSKINFQRDKILKVTIVNNKNLQNMAKSFTNENEENQNQSSENGTEKTNSKHQSIDTNQKENENMNVTIDHNESIEIEQSFLRVNGNDNPFRNESVCIKKEINLLEDSSQGDIPIPLPEDVCYRVAASNSAFSLEADNQSNVANNPLVSVNSQENVSSLNIACYNNFIPPVQHFNNFSQMPHTNSCPCMFLHHHMIVNSHYEWYYGMYNFPMMNPYFPHSHHTLPTFQNELQAPSVNQIARNSIANQSQPKMMLNPQVNPFVGTSSANQLLNLQHGLQQQAVNQMTEGKSVSQQLHLQSPMQSIQEYQSLKNSSAAVLNAFQPVQQHLSYHSTGDNYSSPQLPNAVQEFAKLRAAIFNLNSQLASLQNVWNQSQSK